VSNSNTGFTDSFVVLDYISIAPHYGKITIVLCYRYVVQNDKRISETGVTVARDLSICTTCKMRCAISKSRMRNLQNPDLNLTLTLTRTLAP